MTILALWILGGLINIAVDAWLNGEITPFGIILMGIFGPACPVILVVALILKWDGLHKPIWRRK